jgi:replicative DNA helicase
MAEKLGKAFQSHLAAALCRLPALMSRVCGLIKEEMFDNEEIGDIVAFSVRHFKEKKELLSQAALQEEVGDEYNDTIEDLFSRDIPDQTYITDRVVQFAKQKAVEKAILKAAKRIADGEHEGLIDSMRDAMSVGEDFSDMGEYLKKDFSKRRKEYINPTLVKRIPTGVVLLDECLHGGQDIGTLGVVFGPPKAGKSTVLVNMGAGAACGIDGVNVVHYTLELSARSILKMYDKRIVGRKRARLVDEDPRAFIKSVKRSHSVIVPHSDILVKGFSTRSATPTMLRAHLSMLIANGFIPGLVIVDYADIMKPERRLGEYRHEQASIYEDLRATAQEFGVALWTGCQANRGSVDKDIVTIADIAEAFEKAAIADALIAICRTPKEKASGEGRLFLAAVREKEDGRVIECKFDMRNALVTGLRINSPTIVRHDSKDKKRKDSPEEKEKKMEESVMQRLEDKK